ncbi:MAG TPA: SUMF1/EgtB/PvdO family nonheme iron enzyme, partial [Planctomycetota bacterium]|nr:SUMF1/EgtB/PvdO family nonheme iron enzyme [Planctomycetota bacterium]
LLEVEWRAPSRAGVCRLSVTVSPEGTGPSALPGLTVDVDVEVHAPSTTGMAWIPPGEFRRGDFLGTRNTVEVKTIQNASDEPFHAVHLDGYWIDKHLVTNREFRDFLVQCLEQGMARVEEIAVMGQFDGAWVPYYYFQSFEKLIPNYHDTRNARKPAFLHVIQHVDRELRIKQGMENHPVVDVSWFGAAAYARFHGKKLPSEAQWEKGARGTDGRRFPWGNNMASAYHANLNRELGTELTPVGSFSPTGDSPFGLADMLSDCFEWTADWFNPNYYEDYRSDMPLRNPRGPFWGRSHTIRGFPASLSFPQVEAETSEPVSARYNWRFEFLIGDAFANSSTSFRTVLEAGE